jgi:hypothetical protein
VSDEKWAYAFFFATLLLGVALLFDWADVRKIKKQAIERKHAEISGLLTQADFMKYQLSRL